MKAPIIFALPLVLIALLAASGATVHRPRLDAIIEALSDAKIEALPATEDTTQSPALVGRGFAKALMIRFKLAPPVGDGELVPVEVKPIDMRSATRISDADVTFTAVNLDTGKRIQAALRPTLIEGDLRYSAISVLTGDGGYRATITVSVPTARRALKDRYIWMEPATAKFHFKCADGELTKVSEPAAATRL